MTQVDAHQWPETLRPWAERIGRHVTVEASNGSQWSGEVKAVAPTGAFLTMRLDEEHEGAGRATLHVPLDGLRVVPD